MFFSFLVNPEIIPGRMTLLVTIFLVLINIHNTIQTNSPKVKLNTHHRNFLLKEYQNIFYTNTFQG